MKHLFKPAFVKYLWIFLFVFIVVKVFWFIIEIWALPTKGVTYTQEKGGKALYYRIKLSPNKASAPTLTPARKSAGSIKDIKLLAIYHASDVTVVTVEYKRKTKVLGRGDVINGFMLEGAGHHHATFSKNNKIYEVPLSIGAKSSRSSGISASRQNNPAKKAENRVEGEVTDAGDHKIIDKSLISHYAKNMDDIYKNIGIKEIKNGKKLEGFRISFIKRGSPFAKLGLKRGDTIKSINGQKIDSYNAAFSMYKNIENIENLTLGIQRGKEEMELEYEVN